VPFINDLVSASPIAQWGAFYIEVLHPVYKNVSKQKKKLSEKKNKGWSVPKKVFQSTKQ